MITKIIVIIIDLAMIVLLFPSYKTIMGELQTMVESVIAMGADPVPLTAFEQFVFDSLPIVFLVASLFWIGWGIYRSRSGGIRF